MLVQIKLPITLSAEFEGTKSVAGETIARDTVYSLRLEYCS